MPLAGTRSSGQSAQMVRRQRVPAGGGGVDKMLLAARWQCPRRPVLVSLSALAPAHNVPPSDSNLPDPAPRHICMHAAVARALRVSIRARGASAPGNALPWRCGHMRADGTWGTTTGHYVVEGTYGARTGQHVGRFFAPGGRALPEQDMLQMHEKIHSTSKKIVDGWGRERGSERLGCRP